ncbi:MAG: Wzz/FepE/Etk N-terminal domain-containing protein, partial [Streptosporangiaceae bacterium]
MARSSMSSMSSMSSGPSGTPESFELADYGALLLRRWRTVVVCLLLGLVLSGAYVVLGPKTYTSTASVLVTPTGAEAQSEIVGGRSPTEINLDTEAQIAQSAVVARRAEGWLGTTAPLEDVIDQLTVTVPPNSAILEISFEGSTPGAAKRGAHAFAAAYLANRRTTAKTEVKGQVGVLRGQLKNLTGQLRDVTNKLAVLPTGSAEATYAQTRKGVLTTRISDLNQQISALQTQTVTPGHIISDARIPDGPSSPIVPLYLASGLLAGLLIGLMAAVLRDRSDRRIRRPGDVERLVHLPVLLHVPTKRKAPLGLAEARSPVGQAFHELCHSITATLGHGNHVLLATGAAPGRCTSVVAANLAAALARTGSSTVLVCADLQSFASTWLLGLQRTPGLSDVLLHGSDVSDVEQRPAELPRLRVITPGADGEVASDQLQTQTMERLVAELRRSATYVVVEAPPTSVSADAQALADVADAALVVVESRRAEREQVREGVRQLDRMGAAILGAVVLPAQRHPVAPAEVSSGPGRTTARGREGRPEVSAGTYTAPMATVGRDSAEERTGGEARSPAPPAGYNLSAPPAGREARAADPPPTPEARPPAGYEARAADPPPTPEARPTDTPGRLGRHGRAPEGFPRTADPHENTAWRLLADARRRQAHVED